MKKKYRSFVMLIVMVLVVSFCIPAEAAYTGWYQYKGAYYYLNNSTPVKGWKKINGKWYCFNSSTGRLRTGWVKAGGNWYYLNPKTGTIKTGWVKSGGNWYYLDPSTGTIHTGWLGADTLNNKWYYLSPETGTIYTGWLQLDGNWYYLDPATGLRAVEEVQIGGDRYYFNFDSGILQMGWVKDGDSYILVNYDRKPLTGWMYSSEGSFYYRDGILLKSGWITIDGKTFYLDPGTGAAKTGWFEDNGNTYYLKDIYDSAYYMTDQRPTETGEMMTGLCMINGVQYEFSDTGVLLGEHQQDSEQENAPVHQHTWDPVYKTVTETITSYYEEDVYETVHHDAVYETVHHDAVTHEEPVFSTVHHDAVTSQVWVEDTPETSVNVYDGERFQGCGAIFATQGECAIHSLEAHNGEAGCESAGHWETVPATGHYETVVTAEAWDETVVSGYTTVTDTPAWDEQVMTSAAWDEQVKTGTRQVPTSGTAETEVLDHYECSGCGAVK